MDIGYIGWVGAMAKSSGNIKQSIFGTHPLECHAVQTPCMRRCVPVNVERQILHVFRAQTRRFSSSPLSFGQELFQNFLRPLNKEQQKVIIKKQLLYEPTVHKHVDGDLLVMLEVR
jgi:hypothetical protein